MCGTLASKARNVTVRTFYNAPEPGDEAGRDYDEPGLISADWLASNTPIQDAAYYLCGPRPFLRAMVGGLARKGVPLEQHPLRVLRPGRRVAGGISLGQWPARACLHAQTAARIFATSSTAFAPYPSFPCDTSGRNLSYSRKPMSSLGS